ncbi:MAG TPA: DEAD/DEAH box helicase [Verrucomicrobiae bacterium]|nr:DEAD/DEAH box helicase [Verrucomicrobiae bacterium]
MPFSHLKLHPDLQKGIKELGFTRPTPIQNDAIPPGLAGKDVLACAMTGSGKTAAFLLPILHHLMHRKRGATAALVLTPTRELAAQILEDLNDLAVHTPVSAAAVIGGVGMGPQEHAFRSAVDVIIGTPGRLLDHFRYPYARLTGLEFLVLDEADRMLDMGFLPDIRRILRHIPARRQTMCFSATMPEPIVALTREMLKDPVRINLQRQAAPAVGITQAVYPVPRDLKSGLLTSLLQRGEMQEALVFTRTKHRANRLAEHLNRNGIQAERIHGNRSQSQRTAALAGFKKGRFRVLVATDIAARGIDVEALGHVVNFDVPAAPEDYIHRVGRTARAEATGTAFTFVSPDEESDLKGIERAVGKRLPRVLLPDFDYKAKPQERPQGRPAGDHRASHGGATHGRAHQTGHSQGRHHEGRPHRGRSHQGSSHQDGSHQPRHHGPKRKHQGQRHGGGAHRQSGHDRPADQPRHGNGQGGSHAGPQAHSHTGSSGGPGSGATSGHGSGAGSGSGQHGQHDKGRMSRWGRPRR